MKNLIGKKYDKLEQLAANSNGNQRSRIVVQPYQCSPNPEDYANTKFEVDLTGMTKKQRANNITRVLESSEFVYKSKFTIGMEVEKSRISRDVLTGSELNYFCQLMKGIERDGSCGLEAITNILPLIPMSKWRNKIFDLMHKAKYLIDENYSQSDEMNDYGSYRCGGHMTIASANHTSSELNELMRPYYAIIYALNRKRLANQFCCNNVTARTTSESISDHINAARGTKYQPIFEKSRLGLLEFRLWSRFTSVKQMINRYKLMQIIVDFAVNDRGSYAKLIKKLKPTLLSMYNNDEGKVEMLIELSKHFRKMLMTNKINHVVLPFIWNRYQNPARMHRDELAVVKSITTPTAFRMWKRGEISFARRR